MNGKILAVIPARYASTRLPGKVLADVAGRPLVWHVWRRTRAATLVDEVLVATDDRRVADALRPLGVNVMMTRADHSCGTDRLAEVADRVEADLLVNVQGDEPLIDPRTIDAVVRPLLDDPSLPMATARHPLTDLERINDPSVVKVICDLSGRAVYFSRSPIPFIRDAQGTTGVSAVQPGATGVSPIEEGATGVSPVCGSAGASSSQSATPPFPKPLLHWQHIGLYAYRREAVLRFAQLAPTPLESAEKLEQLRALEHGWPIAVVETAHQSVGVDTPDDLRRVRALLAA